ncbi:serine hydrolase [Fontibacillus panacisegetis]|nr:serine hydrolase [Fontibacillus panacisegetis]
MMIVLYIFMGIFALFLLLVLLLIVLKKINDKKTEQDVLKFIVKNPDRASFYVMENGKILVNTGAEIKRPLASVVKIMVLAEFAEQVSAGMIDVAEEVHLSSLNRFYIPKTDGGAHSKWLDNLKEQGLDLEAKCTLKEVARGMILYSSNANTEFLIEKLGLEAINHRIQEWGLEQHDLIYPLSSSMLIPSYLMDTLDLSKKQVAAYIADISYSDYANKASEIFNLLQSDEEGKWIDQLNRQETSGLKLQELWSAKLPGSTVQEYAHMLADIQEGKLLSEQAQPIFHELMEIKLKNPEPFIYVGQKGGSSISIINQVIYSEDMNGNKIQFALFIHDPFGADRIWLNKKFDLFINKFFKDEPFKQQVVEALA